MTASQLIGRFAQYNKINGQGDPTPRAGAKTGFIAGHWSCENPVTLGHDLKEKGAGGVIGKDWAGFVMSDWYVAMPFMCCI